MITTFRHLSKSAIERLTTQARLLGVTATPLHAITGIQELFENHSFWAYLDEPESYLQRTGQGVRQVDAISDQLSAVIQNGDLTTLDKFYPIRPQSLVPQGENLFIPANEDGPEAHSTLHYQSNDRNREVTW